MLENTKTLLKQIELIDFKYKKLNEANVDSFNIFSILKKSGDEVGLHSRFIYELLNPDSNHKQGKVFIKLFLNELNLTTQLDKIKISREENNIDILIEIDNTTAIIIENKIYSEDHSKQLSKYLKSIKKKGYKKDNITVIYLTLYGDEPNEKIKHEVKCLSYADDIKNWLELCIKDVSLIPTIRETIAQYLNLIKKLTNQSQHKGYIMETKELLLKNDNLKLALDMQQAIKEAKIQIQTDFWQNLQQQLKNENYEFEYYNTNMSSPKTIEGAVKKYYTGTRGIRGCGIKHKIENGLYFFIELDHNIFYGFHNKHKGDDIIRKKQQGKLKKIKTTWTEFGEKQNCWKYPAEKLNFEKFNTKSILNLTDSKKRQQHIKEIVDEVIDLIKQYNAN